MTEYGWRFITDFPEYDVSKFGDVRSNKFDRVRILKQSLNRGGFPMVVLLQGRLRYPRQVATLVAEAWLPPSENIYAKNIWHIDGNFLNCEADNLRWETRPRVLEWNQMIRTQAPAYKTPRVIDNHTDQVYANAFECAMALGLLESEVVRRVEMYPSYDRVGRFSFLRA